MVEVAKQPKNKKLPSKAAQPPGEATKFTYDEYKKILMTHEKNNYNRVYAIKSSTGKFCLFVDHSAILFYHILRNKIGSKAEIRPDGDFHNTSKIGVVSYPSFKSFVDKVKPYVKGVGQLNGGIYYVELKEKVSKADFRMYVEEKDVAYEKANKRIIPKILYPELNAELKELNEVVFHTVRKLDSSVRAMRGDQLDNLVQNMITEYIYAAREEDTPEHFLKNIYHLVDKFQGRLIAISWTRTIDSDVCDKISEKVAKVRATVVNELSKQAYRKSREGLEGKAKKAKKGV